MDKFTDIWIVIDERSLEVIKRDGEVLKFKTRAMADLAASGELDLWSCHNVRFQDQLGKWMAERVEDYD